MWIPAHHSILSIRLRGPAATVAALLYLQGCGGCSKGQPIDATGGDAAPIVEPLLQPEGGPKPLVDLLHETPAQVAVSSRVDNPHDWVEHLVDGRLGTAWNSKTGDLVGGWFGFKVDPRVRVRRVELAVGYLGKSKRGEDLFSMNHRISRVRLSRNGETVLEKDLDPESRPLQSIEVDTEGGDFRVTVLAVKPGTRASWRELAVSELRVLGEIPEGMSRARSSQMPEAFVGDYAHTAKHQDDASIVLPGVDAGAPKERPHWKIVIPTASLETIAAEDPLCKHFREARLPYLSGGAEGDPEDETKSSLAGLVSEISSYFVCTEVAGGAWVTWLSDVALPDTYDDGRPIWHYFSGQFAIGFLERTSPTTVTWRKSAPMDPTSTCTDSRCPPLVHDEFRHVSGLKLASLEDIDGDGVSDVQLSGEIDIHACGPTEPPPDKFHIHFARKGEGVRWIRPPKAPSKP